MTTSAGQIAVFLLFEKWMRIFVDVVTSAATKKERMTVACSFLLLELGHGTFSKAQEESPKQHKD